MSDSVDVFEQYAKEQEIKEKRCLKELGSKPIEDAIEKSICSLTGVEYEADIVTIDFEATPNRLNRNRSYEIVEIKLRLSKVNEPF